MSLEPLRSSNVGRFPYVQKTGWPLLESTGEALVTRHCNQKQSGLQDFVEAGKSVS